MTPICPDIPYEAIFPIGKAAEILGTSRRWLLDKAKSGEIQYSIPIGQKRKKFRGEDLIALWKKRQGLQT